MGLKLQKSYYYLFSEVGSQQGGRMAITYDIKKRIITVSQVGQQRNRLKKIKGAEPITKTGKVRMRAGRLKYGVKYSANAVRYFKGRTKIKDGKGRFWKIKILELGQSPYQESFGKAKRRQFMGGLKHRVSKHKFQGISQVPFSDITQTLKRRHNV